MGKAQAALEFMTTYGWMFMVLIVVLGGLSYMGVLRPQNFISDTCEFTSSLTCGPFKVEERPTDYILEIQLTNNLQEDIQIDSFEMQVRDGLSFCTNSRIQDISTGLDITGSELLLRSRGTREFRFIFEEGANCDFDDSGLDIVGKQRYEARLAYVLAKETNQFPQIIPGRLITEIIR